MMTLSLDKTVGDVAVELPEATRVFEKLRIDYCCGGDQFLSEACANAGVQLADLERMLAEVQRAEQSADEIDFQRTTLGELIAHIFNKHHVYTRNEIVRLGELFKKVVAAHGQNHSELFGLQQFFQDLCADLSPHMFKEEEILFPHILEMERLAVEKRPPHIAPFGTIINPIRMMMIEHDRAGDILRELRRVSSNYTVPADACISYQTLYRALEAFETDLHQHIHLENNILFPRALALETLRTMSQS
jgi:regulator of cell morphogenesis and NO signaling